MASFACFLLFVLVCESLTEGGSSFVLDGQKCVAFSPCTCSGYYVNCYSKGLTAFPRFEVSNVTGTNLNFRLYSNQFTIIPTNSFRNLTVSNLTRISIDLSPNHLNTIERNAFLGIGKQIVSLNLYNNNFTSLPTELGKLSQVESIYLQNNPIVSLDQSTMRDLGRSLKTLSIDLKPFHSWPAEFQLLTSLQTLNVRYLNVTHLDFDVFDGFENTLQTLTIDYSQLEKVPVAVCHLHNLRTFGFSNNYNLHVNSTIFEPCSKKLTSVTSVTINYDNLRYMPDVFRSFPLMTTLKANNNKLTFIHWDTVPSNSPLTYLSLNYNGFTRIPSVINKFHALNKLYMQYNKITSIEDADLSNLSRLQYLYLYNNPIEYISPRAFKNNIALYRIELQYTNLRNLPSSLGGLHNLRYLYLSGSPIQCDCDLSYLKSLNFTTISMNGNCQLSTLTIQKYLTDDLPKCP